MMIERESSKAWDKPALLDIAWVAGIFEGEGCVVSPIQGTRRSLQARINQKDDWLPIRLRELFGGRVNYIDRPAGSAGNRQDSYIFEWHCSGSRAAGFLMTIYKFLSPRRQIQIVEALSDWKAQR